MFNFFKENNDKKENNNSITSIASLLIHAARIDENYSENEKQIIKKTLISIGVNENQVDDVLKKAEIIEKDSHQILEFTQEAKNLNKEKKIILIEALWSIIYSDDKADIYESNLMRRISGLIYLDKKLVGDIKEKVKNQKI